MKVFLLLALWPVVALTPPARRPAPTGPRVQPHTQPHHPHTPPRHPRAPARNYGARADSLNGVPGHAFGDPRSSFPELEAAGFRDLDGYTYYEPRRGDQTGWFGKNAGHVTPVYRFYRDRFAAFDARSRGDDRPLLAAEAAYLFGKGQPPAPHSLAYGEAAVHWDGRRVQAQLLDGHNECRLILVSRAAAAQKAADEAAQQKSAAADRAAKMRADNAPAAH